MASWAYYMPFESNYHLNKNVCPSKLKSCHYLEKLNNAELERTIFYVNKPAMRKYWRFHWAAGYMKSNGTSRAASHLASAIRNCKLTLVKASDYKKKFYSPQKSILMPWLKAVYEQLRRNIWEITGILNPDCGSRAVIRQSPIYLNFLVRKRGKETSI